MILDHRSTYVSHDRLRRMLVIRHKIITDSLIIKNRMNLKLNSVGFLVLNDVACHSAYFFDL